MTNLSLEKSSKKACLSKESDNNTIGYPFPRFVHQDNRNPCIAHFSRCEIHFYIDQSVEKDAHYIDKNYYSGNNYQTNDEVFIIYKYNEMHKEDGTKKEWVPQYSCSPIPVHLIIGASAGLLLGTIIIASIVAIVIVNINDRRAYQRFEQERKQLQQWCVEQNPLYKEAGTNFQNPAFGMKS